ncbi:unnamed protein product [marine sediment metagenome]|uniref:Uncharacterized protein n=1 Tax=marine sediment metagenome TaxID=412755 RepID=X0SHH9_9ZZZZ
MTREEIRKAFVSDLISWDGVIDAYKDLTENRKFEPPEDKTWVRLTLRYGESFVGELGVGGIDIEGGIAFIDIFTVVDKGDSEGNELGEDLRARYKKQDIGDVSCNEVSIHPLGSDELYSHTQVQVIFNNFIE